MFGVLGTIGVGLAKVVGSHLVSAHVNRAATGAKNTLEAAVTGLGARFAMGFGSAFYLTNPAFRHGANICISAVKNSLLGH